MACNACPFAFSDESEAVQNLGCLPTPHEVLVIQRAGKNWSCHEDESKLCAGLAEHCHSEGIALDKTAPLASYQRWYHTGEA